MNTSYERQQFHATLKRERCCATDIAKRSVFLPDIKGAAEHFLVMRGECADQFSDEVVALLRLEAEHQVGARPATGDITFIVVLIFLAFILLCGFQVTAKPTQISSYERERELTNKEQITTEWLPGWNSENVIECCWGNVFSEITWETKSADQYAE